MVLLQTILEFRRQSLKITWQGKERVIPLPAGVAVNSAWMDITHSSPSCETNGKFDYLPSRSVHPDGMEYPKCPIWPADPPRRNLYAEDEMLCHPLVSPIAAKAWTGSCPLWIETGQELLTDEDKYVAMRAAQQDVPIVFEEYEAMPHCFAMVLETLEGSKRCFKGWSSFINAVVKDPQSVVTMGIKIEAKTLKETELDVKALSPFTDVVVLPRMRERVTKLSQKHPDSMSKL